MAALLRLSFLVLFTSFACANLNQVAELNLGGPQVPNPADPVFVNTILTAVNHYRHLQGGQNLSWDTKLASFAGSEGTACDFGSDLEPYGETIGGVFPSTFNKTNWNGIDLNQAAQIIIDHWYGTSSDYICDSTSRLGKIYQQLVWKNTKTIGCAWIPYSCTWFIPDPPMYLNCQFTPLGAEGDSITNVSCNNDPPGSDTCKCKEEKDTSLKVVIGKEAAIASIARAEVFAGKLLTLETTPSSPISDLRRRDGPDASPTIALINSMRIRIGIYNQLKWSYSIAEQAQEWANRCDAKMEPGYMASWGTLWPSGEPEQKHYNLMAVQASAAWNSENPAEHESNPLHQGWDFTSSTYPGWNYAGCAWSQGCSNDKGPVYLLYCGFAKEESLQESMLAGRDLSSREPSFNLNDVEADVPLSIYVAGLLSTIRSDAGNPNPTLKWNEYLTNQAQQEADKCTKQRNPDEMLYDADSSGWNLVGSTKMALATWFAQIAAVPGEPRTDYSIATNPAYQSVGCAWSTKCDSEHHFRCRLSTVVLNRRQKLRREDSAVQSTSDDQETAEAPFITLLKIGLAKIRADANHAPFMMEWSTNLQALAEGVTQKCVEKGNNVLKISAEWSYNQAADPPDFPWGATEKAIESWTNEGHLSSDAHKPNWIDISNPTNRRFGCAWEGEYCGLQRSLLCFFSGDDDSKKRDLETPQNIDDIANGLVAMDAEPVFDLAQTVQPFFERSPTKRVSPPGDDFYQAQS